MPVEIVVPVEIDASSQQMGDGKVTLQRILDILRLSQIIDVES